jgi:hypothetical protein
MIDMNNYCDFDHEFYINFYNELLLLNKKDAFAHYNHNKNEKIYQNEQSLHLPPDFDFEFYMKFNSGLNLINKYDVMRHYMNHGKNENITYNKKYITDEHTNNIVCADQFNKHIHDFRNSNKLIYYSNDPLDDKNQQQYQVLKNFDKSWLKVFICLSDNIIYEEKYNLYIIPYPCKNILFDQIIKDDNISCVYYTDTKLYDEISSLKINNIIFHLVHQHVPTVIINANHIFYSDVNMLDDLIKINIVKKYIYVPNNCDSIHNEIINRLFHKIDTLIVLDDYKIGDIERNTDIIHKGLNADVCVLTNNTKYNTIKYYDNLFSNYKTIFFQNTFFKINQKMDAKQKYIYVVHTQSNFWNDNQKKFVKDNNDIIDQYIFVSDSVKNSFWHNITRTLKYVIIENQIDNIEHDKQDKHGLFISYGSFIKSKNHHILINEFHKLGDGYQLEIYGDIQNKIYFSNLQKHIIMNKINNVTLFSCIDNYIDRLKEAEFFVSLSKNEGCSYAMLEAISLNKKVICSEECITFNQIKYYPNKRTTFDLTFTSRPYVKPQNIQIKLYHNLIYGVNFDKKCVGGVTIENDMTDIEIKSDISKGFNINLTKGVSLLFKITNKDKVNLDDVSKYRQLSIIEKNERETNFMSFINDIYKVYNFVDEIIIVNNKLTGEICDILEYFKIFYNNIFIYSYNIVYSDIGVYKKNTSTFYDWSLSKVTKFNVIFWNSGIEFFDNNSINIIDKYDLHNRTDKIMFSLPMTVSHIHEQNYDDYICFSKLHGFRLNNNNMRDAIRSYKKIIE